MTMIGIDLGTTNSAVCYHNGRTPEMIDIQGGKMVLPSVVLEQEDGTLLVGAAALKRVVREKHGERYLFRNVKRHMGLPFVANENDDLQVTDDGEGGRVLIGRERSYSPEELSAEILKVLKEAAERRLGQTVTGAVIAVPANFTNTQKRKTELAGKMAGFKIVSIKTEPEAAAMAYGVDKAKKFTRVVVFDFGGGTFDIVYMKAAKGDLTVLGKTGDANLGGLNFDRRLRQYVCARFSREKGEDLSEKQVSILKIMPAVEEAKIELTDYESAAISVQGAALMANGQMEDIHYEITRAEFEAMVGDLIEAAMELTREVVEVQAGASPRKVDHVLLVGGMTRVPAVRRAIAAYFGETKLREDVSPDFAVAIGAATQAAIDDQRLTNRVFYQDVTAQPFGIQAENGVFVPLIPAGAPFGEMYEFRLSNAQDGQSVLPVALYEGQSRIARENTLIARHDLTLEPDTAKTIRVKLEITTDESGMLIAALHDPSSGEIVTLTGAAA